MKSILINSIKLRSVPLLVLSCLTGSLFAKESPLKIPEDIVKQNPFFQVWDEEVPTGQVVVAMDGSVLVFKGQGSGTDESRYISIKRSVDGGRLGQRNRRWEI